MFFLSFLLVQLLQHISIRAPLSGTREGFSSLINLSLWLEEQLRNHCCQRSKTTRKCKLSLGKKDLFNMRSALQANGIFHGKCTQALCAWPDGEETWSFHGASSSSSDKEKETCETMHFNWISRRWNSWFCTKTSELLSSVALQAPQRVKLWAPARNVRN